MKNLLISFLPQKRMISKCRLHKRNTKQKPSNMNMKTLVNTDMLRMSDHFVNRATKAIERHFEDTMLGDFDDLDEWVEEEEVPQDDETILDISETQLSPRRRSQLK